MSVEQGNEESVWKRAEACVVERAREGDARAFALLWLRFESKIGAFTRRMCWHYRLDRGEDVWSDVYLAVAGSIATFDQAKTRNADLGAAFCNWAYRIAARVVLAHVMKGRRLATVEVGFDNWDIVADAARTSTANQGVAEQFVLRETAYRIYDRIENDTNTDRAAYFRFIAEGVSQQEAAVRAGINPSTGRSWLKRFRLDMEAETDTRSGDDLAPKKRGHVNV